MEGDGGGFCNLPEAGRAAAMVIRVWIEEDGGFRARLTETLDLTGRGHRVVVVSEPDQVLVHVERWLKTFPKN